MISGKAKELFLKWFKEEKELTGFDDKPIYSKIFSLCEWFKIQNYCISVKSNYVGGDYSAKISFNEGDIDTLFHKDLETAYIRAIEISNE